MGMSVRSKRRAAGRGEGPASVSVVNLGCPKNQVDAEVMLGQLASAGYAIAASLAQADGCYKIELPHHFQLVR